MEESCKWSEYDDQFRDLAEFKVSTWTAGRIADWDFKRNGIELYKNHYAALEAECKAQDRTVLHWTAEEGWEPLCKFLDKEVPKEAFPNENNPGAFAKRSMEANHQRRIRARRNMMMVGVLLSAVFGTAVAWYMFDYKL